MIPVTSPFTIETYRNFLLKKAQQPKLMIEVSLDKNWIPQFLQTHSYPKRTQSREHITLVEVPVGTSVSS